jgi:nucleoside-diphosphate-sugar epimerase
MKKVLVTGATGFVGHHCLLPLLANGYEIHAVSSQPAPPSLDDIRWHRIDLLDSEQMTDAVAHIRPTHLLHFAWITTPGKYWIAPENLSWVQASLGLLQTFTRCGGQRVVMAGTCAEYDWRYGYCSEQVTPLAPTTVYGVCKHALQSMLMAFAAQTGLSAAWGRIFFAYGPREHPTRLVPSVIGALLEGEAARCSHGRQIRDFLYIEDVAEAFATLLASDVIGPVNIASGKPVALKDVINLIATLFKRPDLIQLNALPPAAGDPPVLVGDISRLSREVGWGPKYDWEHGLTRTIDWWRTQGLETK